MKIEYIQNVNAVQSLSDLIMELRIACFGKHLKNWIWMLVMPHGFTSPAAATTASTIWESGSETYYERECDALFDIDGRGNTERLVARNPKLRNLLEDDEYIPSLGQLNLMAHYMDELNKAFAYVSASPPLLDVVLVQH